MSDLPLKRGYLYRQSASLGCTRALVLAVSYCSGQPVHEQVRTAGEWLRTWEKRYFYVFATPSPRLVYSVSVRALSSTIGRYARTAQGVQMYTAPLKISMCMVWWRGGMSV